MSGIKYSQMELERERKARQELRQKIDAMVEEYTATGKRIRELLAEIGYQVVASFPGLEQMISSWKRLKLPEVDKDMNSDALRKIASQAGKCRDQAVELLRELVGIREHGRDEKARELATRVEMLRNRLEGMDGLMEKWQPGKADDFRTRLDGLLAGIHRDEFVSVAESCQKLDSLLQDIEASINHLEGQDRQRQVVLEALQEVCEEMGWDIEDPPRLEDENDPGSSYLFTVDTFSAGRMTFRLSLDGIRVDSPFSLQGKLCYSQFDAISERLKKHGVNTGFKRVEGDDDLPEDRASDALDMDDVYEAGNMEA